MENIGNFNKAHGTETFGLKNLKRVFWNLTAPTLYEHAIRRNEAQIVRGGALLAETGQHTGRSPKDKFIVRDQNTESVVWWDNNGAITPEAFELLMCCMRISWLTPKEKSCSPKICTVERKPDIASKRVFIPNSHGILYLSATC